jgi:drug/metabolite transporter (DMT)-like permease
MVPWSQRPVTVGLAGAACISSSAVLMRLADSSAGATALFRCLFALPVLGVLALLERRAGVQLPARNRWLARLSGVFFAGALILWSPAITAIGAGLSTVLTNLQVLLVPPVAWLIYRERPKRPLLLALPVMLAGVALIAGLGGAHTYGAHPLQGVAYGVMCSAMYAGFIIVMQRATVPAPGDDALQGSDGALQGGAFQRHGRAPVAQPLYQATLGATVSSLGYSVALGEFHLGPAWPTLGWLVLLAMTSQVVGWLLITVSMPRLPSGIVAALLLVQPAGAVALSAAFLRERPSLEQLAGVLLVLAGVFIAARGASAEEARQTTTSVTVPWEDAAVVAHARIDDN